MTYPQSARSIRWLRGRPSCGREASIDRPLESWHVEEHVDRDHHDEDRPRRAGGTENAAPWANERRRARTRRAPLRGSVGEVVELLLDLDAFEPVPVEPALQAVDVVLGPGQPGGRAPRSGMRRSARPQCGTLRRRRSRARRRSRRTRSRRAWRRPRPRVRAGACSRQLAHERVERERDHGRGEEQEQDVPERLREEETEQQEDRKRHELDPARHPDRRLPPAIGSIVTPSRLRLRPDAG